jgi:hypothetical protein
MRVAAAPLCGAFSLVSLVPTLGVGTHVPPLCGAFNLL